MTASATTQTVKIGRVTYTVTHQIEDGYYRQLGWLAGSRGDLAVVVRHPTAGTLMAMGSKTLDRIGNAVVNAALAPIFNTEEN